MTAAAIILAAGKGTRMHSSLPKVMHPVAGLPMIGHVLALAHEAGLDPATLVLAPHQESVAEFARTQHPHIRVAIQTEQHGTGHAVLAAQTALADFSGDLLVLYGDTPLIRRETVAALLAQLHHDPKTAVCVLGFRCHTPNAYGRLVRDNDGTLERIVEYRDADERERALTLCNSGVMALRGAVAWDLLGRIGNNNAKSEYYLTDIVELAREEGYYARVVEGTEEEVLGVNSRAELAEAEMAMQCRLRARAMEHGATLIDPTSVFFAYDTKTGRDVTIEPNVVFGPGVRIEDGAEIRAFSHIAGTHIGKGVTVDPFARLRPGTEIGANARIGNFVEVKKSTIAAGAKVSHLSYIGDAKIGEEANIGAGTITCNYDGYRKHETTIGAQAFIGSNTALVAPVKVGAGAIIAAGSVIVEDVAENALAVAREKQTEKEGWAESFREKQVK